MSLRIACDYCCQPFAGDSRSVDEIREQASAAGWMFYDDHLGLFNRQTAWWILDVCCDCRPEIEAKRSGSADGSWNMSEKPKKIFDLLGDWCLLEPTQWANVYTIISCGPECVEVCDEWLVMARPQLDLNGKYLERECNIAAVAKEAIDESSNVATEIDRRNHRATNQS